MSTPSKGDPYRVYIDRGGTFTDCIGRDPQTGEVRVVKVLSSDRAPLEGIRALLGLAPTDPIPPCDLRMGTTLATNALLERRGTTCLFVTTHGFADLLAMGDQTRPDLFALRIERPPVLQAGEVEVGGRTDAEGRTLEPLDEEAVREALRPWRDRGIDSVAVALLHAHRAPSMERAVGRMARDMGFGHVSLSHEVVGEMGLVGRGDTTVADAYLTPLIQRYVDALLGELPGSRLRIMQSSGGLTGAERFRGKDAILSGPAAGVVATAHVARERGLDRAIGFDMGGTSTDVCRYGGELERVYETEVAGVRVRAPMLALHTVAAGGGSICRYDGRRFTVGPDSAGADPGPLCYGRPEASELTLTDVNVALGRIVPDRFPFALQTERVRTVLDGIVERLDPGATRTREEVAEGFVRVAVENMAEAIHRVSVARGHDVREHALVVFGGAGGQFACQVARRLGIRTVVLHPFAGVLSAYGMAVAPVSWHGEADAAGLRLESGFVHRIAPALEDLQAEGCRALAREGLAEDALRVCPRVDLRYQGTESALTIDLPGGDLSGGGDGERHLAEAFERAHQERYGYARPGHPVEAVTLRVEVLAHAEPFEPPRADPREVPHGQQRVWIGEEWREVLRVEREGLAPGERLEGPALVLEDTGTIFVEPGFVLEHDRHGVITLRWRGQAAETGLAEGSRKRASPRAAPAHDEPAAPDPVLLEVFNNLYMSIAEQMGLVLQRTALSTNIRERLDFSCAVFDGDGGLVANAPHIPVHLGAMGESVRAVLEAHPDPDPGDVFATNDPAAGGSHLPDITVVTPVHGRDGTLRFVVASRGHHADVGGVTPGSMPPFSRTLAEEGVVLRAETLVRAGRFEEERIGHLLTEGPHPARRPDHNIADLQAQIAANRRGVRLLGDLVDRYGTAQVDAYMRFVQQNAAAAVREAIASLPDGEHRFEDALDDGTPIRVVLRVAGDRMDVDFAGTGAQVDGNLNAPRAVTVAAVLYVLRTLVGRPIPLNGGCLQPVTIHIPAGSLLAPDPGRAVAGGNVETSQRVVDVLLGATGRVAASQGTMNNLTFGSEGFGYYETIAGGSGAGPGFAGVSGVHTHMTNTRITDPEVLEWRYPVRLVRFGLRRGSGGAGRWRGGDGVVREIEALTPMRMSILSERRDRSPYGLDGGGAGARGRNSLDGRELPAKVSIDVAPGQRLCIETPGGGGYGTPEEPIRP